VAGRLGRQQAGVHAAEHHGDAAAAVFGGDLVCPRGGEGLGRDRRQIRGAVQRHRLHAVVEHLDLHVGGRQRAQHRQGQRLDGAFLELAGDGTADAGADEGHFHGIAMYRIHAAGAS